MDPHTISRAYIARQTSTQYQPVHLRLVRRCSPSQALVTLFFAAWAAWVFVALLVSAVAQTRGF